MNVMLNSFNYDIDANRLNPVLERFNRRIYQNRQNLLVVFIGDTGTSKSTSAIKLAELLSPRFTLDNIVWNSRDFLDLINSEKRLQKGDVVIYDEAGVNMPKKEWYSLGNRLINKLLETYRHRQIITIFTFPSWSNFDTDASKRIHAVFEAEYIDFDRNLAKFSCFTVKEESRFKKIYIKHSIEDKEVIHPVWFSLPTRVDLEEYEHRKHKFTHDLNEGIEEDLIKDNENKTQKVRTWKRTMTMVLKNPEEFKNTTGKFNRELIKELCLCKDSTARAIAYKLNREMKNANAGV